ncbi:hypothetical protein P389DRAFT_200831 [Cystobasidium minutum MCA 4210]|uniref:uncharacterized protein n=1 Tax=Cystobasidium minutum MCA 4210 TaxID=1397322 RepID=UPI0034CDAEAD|eukprot:jgi/Rhomi1/200831/MIX1660_140_100
MLRCSKGLAKSDRTYRISEKTERNVQVGLPLVTLCHANEIERVNNVGLAIAEARLPAGLVILHSSLPLCQRASRTKKKTQHRKVTGRPYVGGRMLSKNEPPHSDHRQALSRVLWTYLSSNLWSIPWVYANCCRSRFTRKILKLIRQPSVNHYPSLFPFFSPSYFTTIFHVLLLEWLYKVAIYPYLHVTRSI